MKDIPPPPDFGTHHKSPLGLRIIAVTKLISAGLLLALGFGLFHLLGSDLGDTFERFVRHLHLDPESKTITKALADVSGISHQQLKAIDAATFIYALLYIIEGIGLLLAKQWAEYLTVIATASLIPVEIYEIVHKTTALKIAVLIINFIILCYLIYRVRADLKAEKIWQATG